jgi:GDPmannose 4,6-dehydratase
VPRALICGVSGQDGAYLSAFLLERGYEVVGTSRDAQVNDFTRLQTLGVRDRVVTRSMAVNDFRSVWRVIDETDPDEVYYLAGQSSVALSFEQPVETIESVAMGLLNVLEALRTTRRSARVYNACSGECFGNTPVPAHEGTAFAPRSPYAIAKATSHWTTVNYRESYGIFACSGILFNHESPLRPERFVTKKIVRAACRIAEGAADTLRLGDLTILRDWGWAPEYVEAMWAMLQAPSPVDYVIATGESHSLEEFLDAVFSALDLDWRDHVVIDRGLLRPAEVRTSRANPQRAREELGWSARTDMRGVAHAMVEAEQRRGHDLDVRA